MATKGSQGSVGVCQGGGICRSSLHLEGSTRGYQRALPSFLPHGPHCPSSTDASTGTADLRAFSIKLPLFTLTHNIPGHRPLTHPPTPPGRPSPHPPTAEDRPDQHCVRRSPWHFGLQDGARGYSPSGAHLGGWPPSGHPAVPTGYGAASSSSPRQTGHPFSSEAVRIDLTLEPGVAPQRP